MMINCPKCGFSQPEDQYCAKCGVDILAFRPREKTLLQQFMGSTSSQLVALMIAIAIGFIFFQVRNTARHLAKIQASGEALQDSFINEEASEGAADFSHKRDMPAPDMSKLEKPATISAQNPSLGNSRSASPITDAKAAPEHSAAPAASASPTTAASSVTQMRVIFAEVPKTILGEWLTEAKISVGSSDPFAAGVINGFEAKIKAAAGAWRPLDRPVEQAFHLNQIVLVYKGGHDESSGQNVGISLQITATNQDESGTTVVVDGSRNLREANAQNLAAPGAPIPPAQFNEMNFPEQQFLIPKGAAALMSGTLLHRPLLEEEARFYSNINVLRVMTDDAYRAGATEFVIFVQPR